MLKFVSGLLLGLVLAISYVRFNVQLSPILQLPGDLRGGVVSAATSPTFSLTRSQPRSLLSIARLKRTKFLTSPSISSRVRIYQTSLIFKAGF